MQFGNVHSTGFHCNQNVYPQRPQYTQHSQDLQLSYLQNIQSLGTQPNVTHLNLQHTQHSQDTPQPSYIQNMQPSLLQHMQPTYSSTSTSVVDSPEFQSDNELN